MVIGITGGVGCGKSTVLNILEKDFGCDIIEADKVGHQVMEPGQPAYEQITKHFGKQILDENGQINRKKLGEIVFQDEQELEILNHIIHPAVKQKIRIFIQETLAEDKNATIVVEAALLIEDHYQELCDTLWYIYADKNIRYQRLKDSRGYSNEKSASIMNKQLSEEEFTTNCDIKIDNSYDIENTKKQLEKLFSK